MLRYFRNPVGGGEGLLTAGIVLALMIVPIIASTTRDLFPQVPPLPKEGASALGMTDWEVANKVTLPWVRSGIIGATVLGLGRALGETIAVAMIGGASLHIPPTIYLPFTTMAATILTQLDGALTDGTGFAVATLAELALVLAVISVGGQPAGPHDRQPDGPRRRPGRAAPDGHDAGRRGPRRAGGASRRSRWRGLHLPGAGRSSWRRPPGCSLGVLDPGLVALAVERAVDQLTPTGGGLRDQILGTLILMVGVLIIAGTIGVLAGIHLAEFARPKQDRRPAQRPAAHRLGRPLGLPLHRARLRRLRRPRGRAALGLLAACRP